MKYNKKALAWINKKVYKNNVDPRILEETTGRFSNRKKEKVMKEKKLSEKQYEKRYSFLSDVHFILSNGYQKRDRKNKKNSAIPDWYTDDWVKRNEVKDYKSNKKYTKEELEQIGKHLFD